MLVHPFFPEHPHDESGPVPNDTYFTSYIPILKTAVRLAIQPEDGQKKKLPLVVFVSTNRWSATDRSNEEYLQQTKQTLINRFQERLGVDNGEIFFIIARYANPDTLPDTQLHDPRKQARENLVAFAKQLQANGLHHAVIG